MTQLKTKFSRNACFTILFLFLVTILPIAHISSGLAEEKEWALVETKMVPEHGTLGSAIKETSTGWTISSNPSGEYKDSQGVKKNWEQIAALNFENPPARLKPGDVVIIKVTGTVSSKGDPQNDRISTSVVGQFGVIKDGRIEPFSGSNGNQFQTIEGNSPGPITKDLFFSFTVPAVSGEDIAIELLGGPWANNGVRWVYRDQVFTAFDEEEDLFAVFDNEFEGHDCPPASETSANQAAKVTKLSGEVFVNSGDGWIPIQMGQDISSGDKVRTGSMSVIEMKFQTGYRNDVIFDVQLDSNTAVCISHIPIPYQKETLTQYFVRIAKGTLREFTRSGTTAFYDGNSGWGGSLFNLGGGTSIIGVRGTDVLVQYDPAKDIFVVNLKEGNVSVQSGTKEISLKPGQSVEVIKSAVQPVVAFDEESYEKFNSRFAENMNRSASNNNSGVVSYLPYIAAIVLIVCILIFVLSKKTGKN